MNLRKYTMNAENPLISIITPVYNTEIYLNRCFDSLVNQKYRNLEIIIINDGSTDNSINIINEYLIADDRIMLFTQKNEGLSSALNKGLNIATGDWLMFVDSDDWIDLDAVEGLVKKTIEYPNVDLIRSYNRQIDKNNQQKSAENHIESEKLYSRDDFLLSGKIGGFISSLFVKRKIIQDWDLKFSEELKIKMDMVFTFQCIVHCNWILIYNRIFYNYFIRDTSLINTPNFEKTLNNLTASEIIYNYSMNYTDVAIQSTTVKYLNAGLEGFLTGISKYSINDPTLLSAKEVRRILLQFVKKNDIKISQNSFRTLGLFLTGLVDFRLLMLFHHLYHFKAN